MFIKDVEEEVRMLLGEGYSEVPADPLPSPTQSEH
jgi:hypothetical protein